MVTHLVSMPTDYPFDDAMLHRLIISISITGPISIPCVAKYVGLLSIVIPQLNPDGQYAIVGGVNFLVLESSGNYEETHRGSVANGHPELLARVLQRAE